MANPDFSCTIRGAIKIPALNKMPIRNQGLFLRAVYRYPIFYGLLLWITAPI